MEYQGKDAAWSAGGETLHPEGRDSAVAAQKRRTWAGLRMALRLSLAIGIGAAVYYWQSTFVI